MKTRVLLLLLITGYGFFASCTKDDDVTPPPTTTAEPLAGVWNLISVQGGVQGETIAYTEGDVVWLFNFETNTLVVENTIMTTGPEDVHSGPDSGTYTFEVKKDKEISTLYVDGDIRGVLIIEDDILKIDDGLASDGFVSEFKR